MNKALAAATLGAFAMCLSACGDRKQEAAPTIEKAEGEILTRSVTDDMLPYDTVRSQPPLAEPEDKKSDGKPGNEKAGDGDAAPAAADGSQPSAAPTQPGGQPQLRPGGE